MIQNAHELLHLAVRTSVLQIRDSIDPNNDPIPRYVQPFINPKDDP